MKTIQSLSVPTINVLLIDDHLMVLDGLRSMLLSFKKEITFHVISADSGEKALHLLNSHLADIVLVDYQLAGMTGPETIRHIRRFNPSIHVLALSNYCDAPVVNAMMEAGATGFILKSVRHEELLTAITTVLSGKKYYCSEVALVMLAAAEYTELKQQGQLTSREQEILRLIAQGNTNTTIAEALFIAPRTVATHRQNMLVKLKVRNTAELVKVGLEKKLITDDKNEL